MNSPRVTFFLMSYNHGNFLRKSIRSVFAQKYENLHILISDDDSTDGSVGIIQEEVSNYRGTHDIQVNLNKENLCFRHLDKIASLCQGDFWIMGHGDDMFHPNRTEKIVAAWQSQNPSLITSNATLIDSTDQAIRHWYDPDEEFDVSLSAFAKHYNIATGFGAAMGFSRELWDTYGPLPEGPRQMDIIFAFRAALLRGNHYIPEPLVNYRDHGGNMSLWAMEKKAINEVERIILQERDLGNKVANINQMIEELEKHLVSRPNHKEALSVRAPLWERLQKISKDWTTLRHRIALQGHGIL